MTSTHVRITLCYTFAALWLACGFAPTLYSADPAKPKSADSLDDELLKDLGGDKPKKSADKPAAKPASDLDDELLKGLGGEKPKPAKKDGAKTGGKSAGGDDVIAELTEQMREAEELLRRSKPDQALEPKQAEIVKRLNDLIEELKQRQQQQSSSSKKGSGQQKTQQRQQVSQPKGGQGQGQQQQQAQQPARDSSDELKKRESAEVERAKMQEMLKEIWGQLPQRVREQMLQSGAEKFLPKYELLIEQYFKTLAERQNSEKP